MKRIVVVGGGISGLAAAWSASRAANGVPGGLEVTLLERGAEVGGKACSLAGDGWLLEAGPGGFLSGRPELDALIDACGLGAERRPADGAAARRFLYRAGRLREVRANPVALVASGILSPLGLLRLAGEPFIPRGGTADETVWEFAARRIGVEAADRLVAPMVQGIFAGDARRLSVAAAFPRMAALEREHGSLIRGLIAKRGRTSAGTLTSFRGGLQTLPRALAERGGFGVRRGAEVQRIQRMENGGWGLAVRGDGELVPADAVILASEPWATAELLRGTADGAADDLAGIRCPAVSVVGLGFRAEEAPGLPRGFGVLIATGEGLRALGNLWDSHLFAGRAPDGHVLIRAIFGGALDPATGELDEAALIALARAEARRLYGVSAEPRFRRVVRWPRAIPQYEAGHLERVERIERAVGALGGMFVTGFGLRGVAFADAATNGLRCGERAAAWLGSIQHDADVYPR